MVNANTPESAYERLQGPQTEMASPEHWVEGEPRGTTEEHVWRFDREAGRVSRRRSRNPVYETFTPYEIGSWVPALPGELAGDVSEAEAAIQILNAEADPALKPLARLLLRTESIASSRAEGLQVGVEQLARAEVLIEGGSRPKSETSMEIVRNIAATETAIRDASGDGPFTVDNIRAIHEILMEGKAFAGQVRDEQNWIGGSNTAPVGSKYVPPPPEELDRLLMDLCKAVNNESLPPVVQAAIVHAQFETVHPFLDGNGRTGRALIHVVWRRRGLTTAYVPPISLEFARDKDSYIAGLIGFRNGNVNGWLKHFTAAADSSAQTAKRYIGEVQALQGKWSDRLRALETPPRRDSATWQLVEQLPGHPAINVAMAVRLTGKTKMAATNALMQLQNSGILTPVGTKERNRVWEAKDLLELITRIDR